MILYLTAFIFVGLCMFLLCFNVIFRKGKSFPDGEISHNNELRKRGITCAREEELRLWKRSANDNSAEKKISCEGCSFHCKDNQI